ncbi:HNH endonuclease [Deinococcus arenicola]|uniref:HNH endonuclease n=1 Tax=Deinococcus arenicola TaxID=2994950 RepID=A0ABU4DV84_9DEIO|nr:HNH endonuclease [Deinococcus sp. ZS9-10]MDV6376331.1 HNH endonuclease [Deinococcus sp. ZS9-10]
MEVKKLLVSHCGDLKRPDRVEARFWSHVDRAGTCWLWTGTLNPHGYGRLEAVTVSGDRAYLLAHRYSYMLIHGAMPAGGLVVRHTCDTPLCVNPAHLVAGTQADNMRDRDGRGRGAPRHGERNPRARLTEGDVRAIRRAAAMGIPQAALAQRYGVGKDAVSLILKGKRWGHVQS